MGQIRYNKISTEIVGSDTREWLVTVEPHGDSTEPPSRYGVKITRIVQRGASAPGLNEPTEYEYKVPSKDGIFAALNTALALVPSRYGND